MIAIVASALLGLYIFLPELLFRRFALKFRAVTKVQKGRFEEIISGASVALLPFVSTLVLSRTSRFVGHWPFPVDESAASKQADYKTVIGALYSDSYFREHWDSAWTAFSHVRLHQERFLAWMYLALIVEIVSVFVLTKYYGTLRRRPIYKETFGKFFLGRASQWEVLLTAFAFPANSRPTVEVDALTTDNHLYAGAVADYFLRSDGELSGLLLKDIRRFRFQSYENALESGSAPDSGGYWKDIPGANFYLPADKISNLNIRYVTAPNVLRRDAEELLHAIDLGIPFTVELQVRTPTNASDEAEGLDD